MVRPIKDMPQPHDQAALLTVMGMVQYLAKFIPKLLDMRAPLRKLLERDVGGIGKPSRNRALNN